MSQEEGREFVVSEEMEARYLAAAGDEYRTFAIMPLDSGLRVGEALSLDWRNVHLEPAADSELGYITVAASKAKTRKARHVPITPRLSEALRHRGARKGNVFHDEGDVAYKHRWVQANHDRLRANLGLPSEFVPHSMRHTFGTRLGEAGADAFTIMRLMGHSTIAVSARYVHPTPNALERAITKMAERHRPHKSPTSTG